MAKMTAFIIALCYLLGALLAYRALALLTRPAPPEGAREMKTSGARAAALNLSYASAAP
ncbi:hypothetical protein [Sorangium sp. So ce394]|uniref:hypothetical protein n=1 Tax=Sorangium sp. So ce394 TaxID=3133310 RepID=UPI003F5AEBC3